MKHPRTLLRLLNRVESPDWPTMIVLRAAAREIRRQARAATHGEPNPIGRPISSTHPRAEYWRQYKQARKPSPHVIH